MQTIECLQPYRPLLGARAFDDGGREVVGWLHCPRWRALLGWAELLVERNVHGTIPFATNPEPWPHYYDGIHAAEVSHGRRPWKWDTAMYFFPYSTAAQVWDVLMELGDLIES